MRLPTPARTRPMRWKVVLPLAGLVILAALGWWVGAECVATQAEGPKASPAEGPASVYTLHYKFDRTVFYSDEGRHYSEPRAYLDKWRGPIEVAIVGSVSKDQTDLVRRHFRELSRLTGLEIAVMSHVVPEGAALDLLARGEANFLVVIEPKSAIDRLLVEMRVADEDRDLNRRMACSGRVMQEDGRIVKALALIPSTYREPLLRHCIIEETTQALGLYADSDVIQPSMFSDLGPRLPELTLNDKIIVRTLYDPRIRPGMPREEALAVAGDVIGELVDAVRRDGVEAVYQQPRAPAEP